MRGWVEYSTELFNESTIRQMINHYECLLREAVANPAVEISRLKMTSHKKGRAHGVMVEKAKTLFEEFKQSKPLPVTQWPD